MRTGFNLVDDDTMSEQETDMMLKTLALLRLMMQDVKRDSLRYAKSFQREEVTQEDVVHTLKYQARIFLQQENLEERMSAMLDKMDDEDEDEDEDEDDEDSDEENAESMDNTENTERTEKTDSPSPSQDFASGVAQYIEERELLTEDPPDSMTNEELQRLQRNIRTCVDNWDRWQPTDFYGKLIKKSIEVCQGIPITHFEIA
jgi:hypothetical protein